MSAAVEKKNERLTVTSDIQEIATDLFAVEGSFHAFGVVFPLRMFVIRLPESQDLIVYSPFCPTVIDLSSLGTVKAVIAPNLAHDTYAQAFVDANPQATLYSSPSLPLNYPHRKWGTVLDDSTPENVISNHVLLRVLTKFKAIHEVVLLHVPTRTIIAADLAFNFTPPVLRDMTPGNRFMIRALGATKLLTWSFLGRLYMRNACHEFLPQLDGLLEEWDWDRFAMCHGEIVHEGAKDAFREGNYKWVYSVANSSGFPWKGALLVALVAVAVAYGNRKWGTTVSGTTD